MKLRSDPLWVSDVTWNGLMRCLDEMKGSSTFADDISWGKSCPSVKYMISCFPYVIEENDKKFALLYKLGFGEREHI